MNTLISKSRKPSQRNIADFETADRLLADLETEFDKINLSEEEKTVFVELLADRRASLFSSWRTEYKNPAIMRNNDRAVSLYVIVRGKSTSTPAKSQFALHLESVAKDLYQKKLYKQSILYFEKAIKIRAHIVRGLIQQTPIASAVLPVITAIYLTSITIRKNMMPL